MFGSVNWKLLSGHLTKVSQGRDDEIIGSYPRQLRNRKLEEKTHDLCFGSCILDCNDMGTSSVGSVLVVVSEMSRRRVGRGLPQPVCVSSETTSKARDTRR